MENFKDRFSESFLQHFVESMQSHSAAFDADVFFKQIYDDQWQELAFKQRIRHIAQAITVALPLPYEQAIDILIQVAPSCRGVEYLFFPDYVELNGLEYLDISIRALEIFTVYSSAEFAVRPFIIRYPKQMLAQMDRWIISDNEHLRRLASEGFRPRLPWATQLPLFIQDPSPILERLTQLKTDSSLYVRKSVANHLNDMAKDYPERIANLAKEWYGHDTHTDWIVRHGCRTLLKRDHPAILELFGYVASEDVHIANFHIQPTAVMMGDYVEFSFLLMNESSTDQSLRIDYEIHHMKANGKNVPKRFKWTAKSFTPGSHFLTKKHLFKEITTRKYYAGIHYVSIYINGVEQDKASFQLQL